MIIIIDGYNFIKHVTATTFVDQSEIDQWIQKFNEYVNVRNNEILLVFDAGPGFYKTTEHRGDITILYSGQTQTADDLIKDWLSSRKGQDILLVTSDREICDFANRLDIVSVESMDFYKIFNRVMQKEEEHQEQLVQTLHKVTDKESEELDILMELGSRDLMKDQIQKNETVDIRVRSGKKASRQDKRLLKKIEKI